jgi:hypothetical protein
MERDLRKLAIERYLKGEPPKSIYSDLDRSKNWFFKWLKRYQSGEPNWYENQSSATSLKVGIFLSVRYVPFDN